MISRGRSVSFQYCPGANHGIPILLLPGLFAGDWIWDSTWADLKDHGVAVLRLRDPIAEIDITSATIHSLRDTISTILDEVGLSKVVVCGNSLGGLVALDYTSAFPERVIGIVVSGCPGLGETADLGLRATRELTWDDAMEIAKRVFYDPSLANHEVIAKSYAVVANRRRARNIVRYLLAARKYDVQRCLDNISCGALLIWGRTTRLHRALRGRSSPHQWQECNGGQSLAAVTRPCLKNLLNSMASSASILRACR